MAPYDGVTTEYAVRTGAPESPMYAVEGTPEEQSPRETLRPKYRTGEATLESGTRPGVRTEGGSRVRSGRGETLRSDDRAGEDVRDAPRRRGAQEEPPCQSSRTVKSNRPSRSTRSCTATSGRPPQDQARMLEVLGYDTLDAPDRRRCPRGRAPPGSARPSAGRLRARGARGAAPPGGPQPAGGADDRPRLSLDRDARRHPAQRAREPGLVHGVHPVPARDQPGPARGALELPDHGVGPDRPRHRQRVAARREHGGGGGGHAHAPPHPRDGRPCRRRRGLPAPDRGRAGDALCARSGWRWWWPTSTPACPPASSSAWCSSTRGLRAPSGTSPKSVRRPTSAAPWSPWPPTCSR